jgi:cardiolipin synthase
MQALLDAIIDLAVLVSPAKIQAVASPLRGLARADAALNPNAMADTPVARAAINQLIVAWRQSQLHGSEVAGMLIGAAGALQRMEREHSVELVWTGPTSGLVPTRRTEQVLLDLIGGARADLFLVSFVAYAVPSVVAALNSAACRGVRVRILLEASISHGGTLGYDPAAVMRASVPSAELFAWSERQEPFIDGRVHAKIGVVDGTRALITSANLTGHALEKNMEAGVLIHGGPVPGTLRDHLQALIDTGILRRV